MSENEKFLTDEEVDKFVAALDKDKDGCISYTEIEQGLDTAHKELAPNPKSHSLNHSSRSNEERHEFLRRMMGTEEDRIPTEDFKKTVRSWKIPSLEEDKQEAQNEDDFLKKLPVWRRLRAYWEVRGPTYCFLFVVVGFQIGLGVWQCVKYATGSQYQAALGWGVGMAKAAAGALYPTLFFLVLSMSRWTATWMRRIPYVTRFVNWDLSQEFHIKMSIVALVLATIHAVGHLTGSFVFGSMSSRQNAVAALLGPESVPRPYSAYVASTPGWSGLTAIGCFYLLALLSMPQVRKWSYQVFQLGHLLMFPMIAMLMAHGSAALLQFPVMGIILAFPTLMVVLERSTRFLLGFHKVPASLEILDEETVCITATIPSFRLWSYKAGQYVFLQVPQLSFWQWHPFTVSECIDKSFKLHIKTDGDWTSKLRDLTDLKYIGIDGPYGAPAQRFYDFDQAIIVGSGIGVTPFSGILNDLQTREDHAWTRRRDSTSTHESKTSVDEAARIHKPEPCTIGTAEVDLNLYRRVDFHWILRERHYIQWFSSLLNKISSGEHNPNLDIRLLNYVTKKRKELVPHVYRWLLERHRTDEHPYSPLTGLIAPTRFGRPNFERILNRHYEEILALFGRDKARKRKVGVFFCG
jgi:dual oxidase